MQIDFAKHPILKEALYIVDTLVEAGYSAYFVGGAVRDVLLGREIHDVDIATNARPEQTLSLFPKGFATGLQHGTVTIVHQHINYEVTTFRVESDYTDYRRPEQVHFVHELKSDLARRDFTMNAMAINKQGFVVDYFNGIEALHNRMLVAVGDPCLRFKEDALRMVRAIRFATIYKLKCDEALWDALIELRPLLSYISMERIQQEMFKLLSSINCIEDLELLYQSELLNFTKKKLSISKTLHHWFHNETPLLKQTISQEYMFWVILYAYSPLSIEDIKADFIALVFSKKYSFKIVLFIEWLRFWLATDAAQYDSAEYFKHYKDYLNMYRVLSKQDLTLINDIDKVKLITKMYWQEQLLYYPELLLEFEQILFTCGLQHLQNSMKQIEQRQIVTKLKKLKLTGKQLIQSLNKEAGPWLKQLLHLLIFAVNLQIVENEEEQLMAFAYQLQNDGVLA